MWPPTYELEVSGQPGGVDSQDEVDVTECPYPRQGILSFERTTHSIRDHRLGLLHPGANLET